MIATAVEDRVDAGGGATRRLIRSLRPIARLLQPYRRLLIGGVLTNLGVHLATIAAALTGAYLVGRALTGASASQLWGLIWLIVALVIPIALFGWLEVVFVHVVSFRLLNDLRKALYEKFRELSPGYFLRRRSGDVTRAAMSDVELLEIFTSRVAPPLVVALIVPTLSLLVLWMLAPLLAFVVLPFVVLISSVPSWLLNRAEQQGRRMREELGALGANVVDVVQGSREILTTGSTPFFLERIQEQHEHLARTSVAHGRRSGVEHAATDAITAIAMIATLGCSAWLVLRGSLDPVWFPAAVILAGAAFQPLIAVTGAGREIGQVGAAADRITELLHAEPVVRDHTDEPPRGIVQPSIVLEGVRFRYGDDLPEVLHGISFEVGAGELVALAGHSGAGKSTCANLILRMWDPTSGVVRLGGHDLRDFPQRDLRARIAYVPQDTYLFGTTVRENIALANPGASFEDLVAAATYAQALEFIDRLPEGWDTVLGERGVDLSGGQRQRVAIARALLRDAPVLVMDEAVSNLDAESEAALGRAILEMASRRTVLVIAHRPSTIRMADRVVVLAHGDVAEEGRFDALLAQGGELATLLGRASELRGGDA